jgi:uncharacterized protein (TIGR03083 family)
MQSVQVPDLIDRLAADGVLLAAAATRAGWDAAVPGTGWDVRALVTHVGGVHRWAADIVATNSAGPDTAAGRAVGAGPPDDELLDWFVTGHSALVQTLRGARADLDCFTFLPADSALHFWARRQAHETAIHRADAEGAAGTVTPFEPAFAQDGIAEIVFGFGRRRMDPPPRAGTIALAATDGPSWQISLGGERITAGRSDEPGGADVTVRGRSSELYLWLWNRPSTVIVDGDGELARVWSERVRVRWS